MTRRLLLLNGLAVLMIPLHHTSFFGLQAMFLWTNRYMDVSVPNYDQLGSFPYYVLMFLRQFDAFGVPAFLFVSGYFVAFMARGSEKQVTWGMFLPRITALLVPLALWTMIRYLMLMRYPTSIDDLLDPYYYIVVLVQLYLLAPILVPWARSNWASILLVSAFVHLGFESIEFFNALGLQSPILDALNPFKVRWIFPAKMLNFILGLVAGLYVEKAFAWLNRIRWLLLASVLITLSLTMVEYEFLAGLSNRTWLGPNNPGLSRILYSILVAPCFLAFPEVRFPQARILGELGAKSLGIYLANIPFAFSLASIMYHLTPRILGIQSVYIPILMFATVFGPLALMAIWKRSPARSHFRYVFG